MKLRGVLFLVVAGAGLLLAPNDLLKRFYTHNGKCDTCQATFHVPESRRIVCRQCGQMMTSQMARLFYRHEPGAPWFFTPDHLNGPLPPDAAFVP